MRGDGSVQGKMIAPGVSDRKSLDEADKIRIELRRLWAR
jgi:hypothetical protein